MLISIQFLRFVAAMMVVLFHTTAHLRASGHAVGNLFGFAELVGFAGVDVFFVISGFIMAWTSADATGAADALDFARRRVARIFSGYWPFYLLALGLFVAMGGHYLANAQLLRSAFLWPTPLQHLVLPVAWTLIFELSFYLLFTLLIGFTSVRRSLVIKLLAFGMLVWTIYTHFWRQAYDPGQLELMNVYEQYLLFPYLLEFLVGALLAGWLRKNPQGWSYSLLIAGVVLFILSGWINHTQFDGRLIQGYYIIWRVLIFGSASVFLLAGVVRLENRGWGFAGRFSLLAGGASYAIYLSHTLILALTQHLGFNAWVAKLPAMAAQAAFLLLALAIMVYSMLHYRLIERPLHHLFQHWLRV